MMKKFWLSVLLVVAATGVAQAKKVALVIGNSAYQHATELPNPVNDARAMTAKLEALDFEVVTGFDQDYPGMQTTVNTFARQAIGAEVALLFYAGHGIQVRGENYLIPIDAALKDETALDFEAIPVDFIIRQMSRDVRLRMIFLDACRDNPLAKTLARSMDASRSTSIGSGLAEIKIEDEGEGTVIAFATSPGDVAFDGKTEHSPFTTALLAHIDAPDLPLSNVMTRVTKDVFDSTEKKQRPWINTSLIGEIYLNKTPVEVAALGMPELSSAAPIAPAVPQLSIVAAPAAPAASDPVAWDQEKSLFEFARSSGAEEDFKAYIAAYPKGHFADMAKNIIARNAEPEATGVREASLGDDAKPNAATESDARSLGTQVRVASVSPDPSPSPAKVVDVGTDVTEAVLAWDKERRREVQARLKLDGFEVGTPDGSFGPRTRQAVTAWQTSRGIAGTGYFNQAQYELLVSRTLQTYAAWEIQDRSSRASAPAVKPTKTRSAQKGTRWQKPRAESRRERANRRSEGVYVGRAEPRRRNSNGDAAGAAFIGGLIGGAIGGAIGR